LNLSPLIQLKYSQPL